MGRTFARLSALLALVELLRIRILSAQAAPDAVFLRRLCICSTTHSLGAHRWIGPPYTSPGAWRPRRAWGTKTAQKGLRCFLYLSCVICISRGEAYMLEPRADGQRVHILRFTVSLAVSDSTRACRSRTHHSHLSTKGVTFSSFFCCALTCCIGIGEHLPFRTASKGGGQCGDPLRVKKGTSGSPSTRICCSDAQST